MPTTRILQNPESTGCAAIPRTINCAAYMAGPKPSAQSQEPNHCVSLMTAPLGRRVEESDKLSGPVIISTICRGPTAKIGRWPGQLAVSREIRIISKNGQILKRSRPGYLKLACDARQAFVSEEVAHRKNAMPST